MNTFSHAGLEYLHKGCNPPLIHRDVKAANILLNAKLEAKIADFGLTKAYRENDTHMSNTLVGTLGYVDPEYANSAALFQKKHPSHNSHACISTTAHC